MYVHYNYVVMNVMQYLTLQVWIKEHQGDSENKESIRTILATDHYSNTTLFKDYALYIWIKLKAVVFYVLG